VAFEHLPRHIDVAIGYNPSVSGPGAPSPDPTVDPTFQGGWENDDLLHRVPIMLLLENMGQAAFTVALKQSNDNAASDPYAAINFRSAGASVASLAVNPGGKAVIILETTWTKKTLGLFVTPVTPGVSIPFGRAVLTYFFGEMVRLERPGVAP
jgi:hypothetical protein